MSDILNTAYKLISQRLKDTFPDVEVDIYDEQYHIVDETGQSYMRTPTVLVDLGDEINWKDTGTLTQEGEIDLKLHLVTEFFGETGMYETGGWDALSFNQEVFQNLQTLQKAFHGWQMKDPDSGYIHSSKFTRRGTKRESLAMNAGLRVWIVRYRGRIYDNSMNQDLQRTETTIQDFRITKPN